MLRPLCTVATIFLLLSGGALAQTASLTWQVSADEGQSWSNSIVVSGAATLRVRAAFSWSDVPGDSTTQGFGGSYLDAIITGANVGDMVTDIQRPEPFNFTTQNLVASRYSGGIKIDSASDAAEPGAGIGWIAIGQSPDQGIIPNYNQNNPAIAFTYNLHTSEVAGVRTISNVFNSITGRASVILLSRIGASFRFSADQVTINTATITVIPAPSAAALVPIAGLLCCRRRHVNELR